jgi:hypothetical protein
VLGAEVKFTADSQGARLGANLNTETRCVCRVNRLRVQAATVPDTCRRCARRLRSVPRRMTVGFTECRRFKRGR